MSDHPFWIDLPEVAEHLERVRALVGREAASAGGVVGHALAQYVSRPGKMVRPAFVLIGSWAGTATARKAARERIVQIAASIETLHLATLIHDDVIDDADRRRGEPSLHALYGRKQAVLMGDYLLSRCFTMIAEGTERENALRLASATGHLVRGEISQMLEAGRYAFSRRAYLRRIAGKTAMLFGLSLVTGARETRSSTHDVAALARVGYCIGMAFQIIDDILDFTACSESIGKPAASDLRSGIYTLPAIEAVLADRRVRPLIVPPPENEQTIARAIEAIREAGGIARARRLAALYTRRANAAIASLSSTRQREVLCTVTGQMLNRKY